MLRPLSRKMSRYGDYYYRRSSDEYEDEMKDACRRYEDPHDYYSRPEDDRRHYERRDDYYDRAEQRQPARDWRDSRCSPPRHQHHRVRDRPDEGRRAREYDDYAYYERNPATSPGYGHEDYGRGGLKCYERDAAQRSRPSTISLFK